MKQCGYGCGYWDSRAKNCNVNPKPVTERSPESVGCKFHNGPDAPLDGQLEFPAAKIYLMPMCHSCKGNPATHKCGFEALPDEETGEVVIGLKCTGFEHVEEETTRGSLCSRCASDPTNNGGEPCGGEVDDIDDTCTRFQVAAGAWPCSECGLYEEDMPAAECDMQEDGLCDGFLQKVSRDDDPETTEDINQICKGCAAWRGNILDPDKEKCSGKTDGSVECDDFEEKPESDGISETLCSPPDEEAVEVK